MIMRALVHVNDADNVTRQVAICLVNGQPTWLGKNLVRTAAQLSKQIQGAQPLAQAVLDKLRLEGRLIGLSQTFLEHHEPFCYTLYSKEGELHLEVEGYGVIQYRGALNQFDPDQCEKQLVSMQ